MAKANQDNKKASEKVIRPSSSPDNQENKQASEKVTRPTSSPEQPREQAGFRKGYSALIISRTTKRTSRLQERLLGPHHLQNNQENKQPSEKVTRLSSSPEQPREQAGFRKGDSALIISRTTKRTSRLQERLLGPHHLQTTKRTNRLQERLLGPHHLQTINH